MPFAGARGNQVRAALMCLLAAFCGLKIAQAQVTTDHDTILAEMHKRLTSDKGSNRRPLVFVGEINNLGPVFQWPCKSAVSQRVDFTISQILWGEHADNHVQAGYINCTMMPLPSPPFTLHAKVIMYCDKSQGAESCLAPLSFTEDDLHTVESWVSALRDTKGDTVLLTIHAHLLDTAGLVKSHGFVVVADVIRNSQIRQTRCSSGTEWKVAYRIDEVLWDYPDSMLSKGYEVSRGVTNCRQHPLPAAFSIGTKVIVYCDAEIGAGYNCFSPARFSEEGLKRVRAWIEELRRGEGDPVLMHIHAKLQSSMQHAPNYPILLLGTVKSVEAPGPFHINTVTVIPTMHVTIGRILWGYYRQTEIVAECPSRDCSKAPVGSKVIAYCENLVPNYAEQAPSCRLVTAAIDENVQKVEAWTALAKEREPAVILEKVQKTLATAHSDENWTPRAYRGHVESIGKAENGVAIQHFVHTWGPQKINVNLEFRFPYPHVPPAIEIGKQMITFCYQRDDICYADMEYEGIIDDSDAMYFNLQKLVRSAKMGQITPQNVTVGAPKLQ